MIELNRVGGGNAQLDLKTGGRGDTVRVSLSPSVTALVIDRFNFAAIAIDSGAGDDNVFVQTRGVVGHQIELLTGDGDDEVLTRDQALSLAKQLCGS